MSENDADSQAEGALRFIMILCPEANLIACVMFLNITLIKYINYCSSSGLGQDDRS